MTKNPMKSGAGLLDDICIAGITPFTTIDFPGRLAGVFYLQGCPWRCRYCHNSEFWPLPPELLRNSSDPHGGPPAAHRVPLEKILEFLEARRGHLDGIVFSGGEPTIHERLPVWMRVVKDMGFEIGLHTGGMVPECVKEVLPLCNWVGMDIKAPFHLYEKVTRIAGSGSKAKQSAELILQSGVPYECRTTFHPELLSDDDILAIARELVLMGCEHYVFQMFRSDHCQDKALRESNASPTGISINLRQTLRSLFPNFLIRE